MTIVAQLVNLLMIVFVASVVWRKLATSDSLTFWSAAIWKLATGVSLGLLYKYYYDGGDTFTLFDLATSDFELIVSEPRSLFFVYIISLVNVITINNYWITSLWFSLFSFICAYRLVSKLDEAFPSMRRASRIALLFVPSVVFWSSGIIKESLAFGAVAVLALYFLSFMRNGKVTWKAVVEIILALVLLLNLKYYWAAVLLPAMITALILKKLDPKKLVAAWYLLVFVLLCVVVSFTHPNLYLGRFLAVIVENHDLYAAHSPLEKIIEYSDLSANWISVLINSPWALWSGLFRPLVFEVPTLPGFLAGLENAVILVLFAWKIKYIRMPAPENRLIVFAVLTYAVILCIFLALSTPNLGTLSRYRIGFLPFFVLLILENHPILNFINGKPSHHIRS